MSAYPGTVNIHPSLLPKYRGAAPVQRALQVAFKITYAHYWIGFLIKLYEVVQLYLFTMYIRMVLKKLEYH